MELEIVQRDEAGSRSRQGNQEVGYPYWKAPLKRIYCCREERSGSSGKLNPTGDETSVVGDAGRLEPVGSWFIEHF